MTKCVLILFTFSLIGCSHFSKDQNEVTHKKEKIKIEKTDLISGIELVENNLNQATREAIAKGIKARNYLASDLFLKANDASLNGNTDLSSLLFKYIVRLTPNDIYIRKKYAVELIKSNRIEKAKDELLFLIKEGDDELKKKARLLLAGVYSALGKKKLSKNLYKEIVNAKSGNKFEACIFLSKAYAKEESFKKSFNILDQCSRTDKDNVASYLYYKARVHFDRDHKKKAITFLKKALRKDKTHYQSALLLGHLYESTDSEARALVLYKNFLKSDPMNYGVLNKYVNLLFVKNELEQAVPYLERLIELDPTNLNIKVRLGVIYTEMDKISDAKSIFKEVLEAVPNSDKVLYYLASLYQHSEDNESAIRYYSKINSESPLYFDSHLQVARILNVMALQQNLVNGEKAEDRLFSFVKEERESKKLNLELKVVLAEYYESMNRPNDAIEVLEKISESEDFSKSHKYRLAILYEQTKKYQQSDKIMLKMLDSNPENADALNFIGYSMLERGGDLEAAYGYIRKAIELKPNDSTIRDSLGWYYYKKGQFEKAYKEIKTAWKDLKDDLVVTKHLALVYKAMKRYDKAKEFYVEALRNVETVTDREELLRELESIETLRYPASE